MISLSGLYTLEGFEKGEKEALKRVEQKIYELQLKYEKQYGCAIPEMYSEIVYDLLEWIKEEMNNDEG